MTTWLETLASEREHLEADWDALKPSERRLVVLRVLADQACRAQSSEDSDLNPRKAYVADELLAADVARRIGIPDTRRNGSGAVAGSWSGYRSAALRVVPTLRSLIAAGLAYERPQPGVRTRQLYRASSAGRDHLRGEADA